MGLFQHRPEEPTEWAGLPSEPLPPRSPSDHLGDVLPIDLPLLGGMPGSETIALTIEPVDLPDFGSDGGDGE